MSDRVFKYGPISPRRHPLIPPRRPNQMIVKYGGIPPKPAPLNKPEGGTVNPFEIKSLYQIITELLEDIKRLREEFNNLKKDFDELKEENRKEELRRNKASRMLGSVFPITDGPDIPLIDKNK